MMTVSQLCLIFIFSFVLGTQSQTSPAPAPGSQTVTTGEATVLSPPPLTCEPLRSSLCLGMPYNMTAFPNSVGHSTQEEAERDLNLTVQAIIPLGCPAGFFQFMCLQYMQPCDRSSIPCRELCETGLKGCYEIVGASGFPIPTLDLDCSLLPAEESGLCFAEDPSGYPFEGEATVLSPPPLTCEPLRSSLCLGMPYNMTAFPNSVGHSTQEEAERDLNLTVQAIIPLGCPAGFFQFMCLQYMQPCDRSSIPCRELCETGLKGCYEIVGASGFPIPTLDLDCSLLPAEESGLCFAEDPSGYPFEGEATVLSPPPLTCEPLRSSLCLGMPYNMTAFPNSVGHSTQEEAERDLNLTVQAIIPLGCPAGFFQFMCLQYMQPCDRSSIPCRELCETGLKGCYEIVGASGFPIPTLDLDCSLLPAEESGLCFAEDPSGYPFEGEATVLSPPPLTCEPLRSSLCLGMPYNMTAFPNSVGHSTQEEAERDLNLTVQAIIPLGCPAGFFQFMCLQYMQPCDRSSIPCRELCETGLKGCYEIVGASGFPIPTLDLDCSLLPAEESGLCFAEDPSGYPFEDGTAGLPDSDTEFITIISETSLATEMTTLPNNADAPTVTDFSTSAAPPGLNCTPACGANETCSDVGGSPQCVCVEGYTRVDENSPCEVKTCGNIQCGDYGECVGNNTAFVKCNCDPNFSFKEGDICIGKTCGNSNVCSGPGDICEDHWISFMCFCGENRTHNEDQSDCVDKTCENSDSCSNPEDDCQDHYIGFMCTCGKDRMPVKEQTDCVAKTCDNSCNSSTEQCSDENGYNCTCKEGYSRPGDDWPCQEDQLPTTEPNLAMTTGTPLPAETLTSTDNLETPELTTEPIEATTPTKPTKTTKSQKTAGSTKPTKPGESSTSSSTPNKKDVTGGHNYTGALIGLFIFLVVTCFVFVAVYVVRRRKLRNNYGRLDEDNEGDSGWSAFSKNPIYRGDRDYQLL